MTVRIQKVLYTAEALVEGGRGGCGRTSDGRLDVNLSVPKEMSGDGGPGTNPEQLFARTAPPILTDALITAGGSGEG